MPSYGQNRGNVGKHKQRLADLKKAGLSGLSAEQIQGIKKLMDDLKGLDGLHGKKKASEPRNFGEWVSQGTRQNPNYKSSAPKEAEHASHAVRQLADKLSPKNPKGAFSRNNSQAAIERRLKRRQSNNRMTASQRAAVERMK